MVLLTRGQFHIRLGQALTNAREKHSLSRAQLAEQSEQIPVDPGRHMRKLAALSLIAGHIRRQKCLSRKQVTERANLPVEFVRDMETGKISNPETYSIYCLAYGLRAPLTKPLKRESTRYPARSWMRATGRFAGRKNIPRFHNRIRLFF